MTLDESIQGMRLQVIRRATAVGVSAACREAGISRTLFYCIRDDASRSPEASFSDALSRI